MTIALLLVGSAHAADDAIPLSQLIQPLYAGVCISIQAIRTNSAVVQLTPEQFQFVRAFWMAIPPASQELPPGDKAFIAKGVGGEKIAGLFDDGGQVCSALPMVDWLEKEIDEVGRGEVGKRGSPL